MAHLRSFGGTLICPVSEKCKKKKNFGRSVLRMNALLCKVSARNGTTDV